MLTRPAHLGLRLASIVARIEPRLPILYLLLCGPLLVVLCVLQPLNRVPDETAHLLRADSLLHGEIIGHRETVSHTYDHQPAQVAGIDANDVLIWVGFFLPGPDAPVTRADLDRLLAMRWAKTASWTAADNTAVYPPVFYVPSALALGVAHAARLTPAVSAIFGRLCNVVVCVALGTLALHLASFGRLLLFCLLASPMTLSLDASFSQDGPLLATVALGLASLTRPSAPPWLAAICIACAGAAKPPLIALSLLLLLPLGRSWRARLPPFLLAFLPGLLWAGYAAAFVSTPFMRPPYHPGPLFPGDPLTLFRGTDPAAQLRVFLADPLRLITLPARLFAEHTRISLIEMIGVLGLINLWLPMRLLTAWKCAYAAAAAAMTLRSRNDADALRWPDRLCALLVFFAVAIGICDIMYLSWTLVGAERIEGVEGRYFLPLLGVLVFVLPRFRVPGAAALRGALAAVPLAAAAAGIAWIPFTLLLAYYIH